MTDDQLLKEILESPLDDLPTRRLHWATWVLPLAIVIVVGATLLLRDGGVEVPTDPGDAVGTVGVDEVVVESSDQPAVAEAPSEPVLPEAAVFHEAVALGEAQTLWFGGFVPIEDGTRPFEGTWILDAGSGAWDELNLDIAPSPRVGHAMALHPPSGQVVLFGGGTTETRACPRTRFCAGPEDHQVWHYDPVEATWTDMTPPVPDPETWPAARFGSELTYEPVTERLIMYGGVGVFGERFTPTFYEDTWAYDPVANEWEQLTFEDEDTVRPPGRTVFGMAWHAEASRIMLFGGDSLAGTDDDRLWSFDPESGRWEDLGASDIGPRDRWFHGLTIDPQSGRIVMIGGVGSIFTPIQGGSLRDVGPLDEVWTWSPSEGWVALNSHVEPLAPVVAVGDPGTLSVIVYDGHDVLSYDPAVDSWSTIVGRSEEAEG